jgi:hypothetical protein
VWHAGSAFLQQLAAACKSNTAVLLHLLFKGEKRAANAQRAQYCVKVKRKKMFKIMLTDAICSEPII